MHVWRRSAHNHCTPEYSNCVNNATIRTSSRNAIQRGNLRYLHHPCVVFDSENRSSSVPPLHQHHNTYVLVHLGSPRSLAARPCPPPITSSSVPRTQIQPTQPTRPDPQHRKSTKVTEPRSQPMLMSTLCPWASYAASAHHHALSSPVMHLAYVLQRRLGGPER